MYRLFIFCFLLGLTSCFKIFSTRRGFRPLHFSSVDVSDVENDNVIAIESFKNRLLASGFSDRGEINNLILQLEKSNPMISGALVSSELQGTWNVLFSGSLTDPGLLAYQVAKALPLSQVSLGDLEIAVSENGTKALSKCTAQVLSLSLSLSFFARALYLSFSLTPNINPIISPFLL